MAADTDGRIKDVLDDILTLVTAMDTRVDTLEALTYLDAYNALTSGQGTMPRLFAQSNAAVSMSTGTFRLTYFTAKTAFTTANVNLWCGGTAAGATPTLVRAGLYSIAANGDGTLVASFANDTTIFAAANTLYAKAWTTPVAVTAGARYAVGVIVVTAAAAPTLPGAGAHSASGINAGGTQWGVAPRVTGRIDAQSDLPSSFVAASVAQSTGAFYATILP